jgi:oxygen-independent coproporphyrinogen-3 oxidase
MLILEEKTALYAKRDKLSFPSEEQTEQEYLKISKLFCDAGYSHYEISNFAKSGCESKHNLKYWNTEEYIGIGPSAYSFVDGKRFHYENDLKGFINSPKTEDDGEGGDLFEYVMLALRLKKGLREEEIKRLFSKRFSEKFIETSEKFSENGFLTLENGILSFTTKGMLVSNSLITEFMEENMYEDI